MVESDQHFQMTSATSHRVDESNVITQITQHANVTKHATC